MVLNSDFIVTLSKLMASVICICFIFNIHPQDKIVYLLNFAIL